MKGLIFAIILGMMLLAPRAWSQEDKIEEATASLQSVLLNLQQSVAKLAGDNDQLALRDKNIKLQVLQLQMQLGQLESQGEVLDKAAEKLQDKNTRRAQQVTRLEDENYDLDDHIQKTEGGIKLIQQSLDAGYHEDQKLLLQLKGMANIAQPLAQAQSPDSQALAHRQKEKLELMKMVYDSQERQEALHQSILEFQKNTRLGPAADALAHQQLLNEQIKDLEAQLAAYPQERPAVDGGPADQWDETQLRQLERELKVLERNYAQLKELTGLMSKKAQDVRMTASEQDEAGKLQGSIEDLNRQAVGLKAGLEDLRSQMVDLDKRKSRLETMVQQTQ